MKILKGDFFVKLIDFYATPNAYFIVTEYFEGKILENFLKSRQSLSESLVQHIIRMLAPGFKELSDKNIILDFLSTKSFCFKFFKTEDNFMIKFFDYGLSYIFTDEVGRRNFLLTEGKYGNSNKEMTQKTNVLSTGMVIYKLLFGETIYQFSTDEDPQTTINKSILNKNN
jgi:serine/threonine protein kinase